MAATEDQCLPSSNVHPSSHEETKILAQSAVRSLELRGRVTTCILGSVVGRTQAPVGCYIRCLFDRFVMVRFQPCKMCRPMLFRTLIPIKRPFHALPFHCRARWLWLAIFQDSSLTWSHTSVQIGVTTACLVGNESGGQTLPVYPPHPEEGASTGAFRRRKHRLAPVSKDGAAPMVRDAAHEAAEIPQTL